MGCNSSLLTHRPRYARPRLTGQPAYGIYIGNLKTLCSDIEDLLLQDITEVTKERIPFLCVVNPPRHGKSLLLDTLFLEHEESVVVIPITYNSNTSFSEGEIESPAVALQYFWLRVLRTIISSTETLEDLFERYLDKPLHLQSIRKIAKNCLISCPFANKSVLICVDEFSRVTDRVKDKWTEAEQKSFINLIHNEKTTNGGKFVQFVFTGFNEGMTKLLNLSSAMNTYVLELCDFSSSRPLLQKIRDAYNEHDISLPQTLFEAVKSTPGVVGMWAQDVVEGRFATSLAQFGRENKSTWLKTVLDHTNGNLTRNWALIKEYLCHLEADYASTDDRMLQGARLASNIVLNEIGIGLTPTIDEPTITPVCFALIIRSMIALKSAEDNTLLNLLNKALNACDGVAVEKSLKNGESFEAVVHHCLAARILLRSLNAKTLLPSDGDTLFAN